uniref:Neuronal pentraxin-1-like n=1 Tax=Sinocyclocheilus anshuiensis TaxID=1608454 RepID=A0A671Q337_9TELE
YLIIILTVVEWLFSFFFCAICFSVCAGTGMPGSDYNPHPRFICTPIPADADPGMSEEAKATILHLRESLVQQKETILDQRETIRELTAKLNLCEGLSRTPAHLAHHAHHAYPTAPDTGHLGLELGHYGDGVGGHHGGKAALSEKQVTAEIPSASSTPEQMSRVLQSLKERLDNLQVDIYMHFYSTLVIISAGSRKNSRPTEAFQIGFPMRTNYMYGRVKRSLLHEIFSFTLCLWMKAGIGPGLGTPFSYSVPGQANELVLIEWGNNPMELLVDDRAVTLPLSVNDGKWHHVCVTWSTRDGLWEAYQDGVKRGSGENLSPWHPIKPGGVFILGQEQDTLGGRFDATQAFVGEISDVQMWSHVLTPHDIYSLASCGGHMTGDIIAWAESVVELEGQSDYKLQSALFEQIDFLIL